MDALLAKGALQRLEDGFLVTPIGVSFFAALGIDARALCKTAPPIARSCIDWTQRRPHLSGALGRAMLQALLERGFIRRAQKDRALHVVEERRHELQALLSFSSAQSAS